MKKMIYLSRPYFGKNEIDAVQETFDSGWVAGQGPKGRELSEFMKQFTNTKFAIPVNNCTAGLHLALLSIGITSGDEVIVSDYTFPATGHSVLFCGAKPRFVDVNLQSYNIEPSLIEEKINEKTKAIIVVHQFGKIADMDEIMRISKKYDLKVIEDAACAMGAKFKKKLAGTFGDIAAFSFHARKNVTSGEGGIVVTNNEKYANIISSLSCFGIDSAYKRQEEFQIPIFKSLGYNYKLADINAAIALKQLKKYPKVLKRKRKLVNLYNSLLKGNQFLNTPVEGKDCFHVYQTYSIKLKKEIDRNKLIISLRSENIQTQIGTYALHLQPIYKSTDTCSNSLSLYNNSLALPLYYDLKEKDVVFIVEKLNYFINKQINGK